MSKYKLIIEYYQKGNNNSQIATLCSCSRTIVWTVLKRIKALRIEGYVLNDMSEEEIASLLFPERAKAGDGYLIPDFKWEEFQMCKTSFFNQALLAQILQTCRQAKLDGVQLEKLYNLI